MRYINRRVFTQGSAFCGSEHNIFTSSPSKSPKNILGTYGKPMGNTYLHNCMMHRDTMLKFGTLFDPLTLPSTLSTHKSFSVRGTAGGSIPHIKFWDTLFIAETIRNRKLKFGMLVGICWYYGYM